MTRAERISIARRSQPLEELRRKMLKAARRNRRFGAEFTSEEGTDWCVAKHHAWRMRFRTETLLKVAAGTLRNDRMCFLCHAFAGDGEPMRHKDGCTLGCPPPMMWGHRGLTGPSGPLP